MIIERVWAMPNHRTFEIIPSQNLIREEMIYGLIIEPFPFESKVDCFDYLSKFQDNSADFGLIDPPYSVRQVSEHYHEQNIPITGWHTGSGWIAKVRRDVARVMKPGSKTITFGWNSIGIGKQLGFEIKRILLVSHGGWHNDTICTVERKVPQMQFPS
jgi:hypothetical protein